MPKIKATMSLREHAARGIPQTHFSEAIIVAAETINNQRGGNAWKNGLESYRNLRKWATENYRQLGEATPATAFGQLLRAGVQLAANGWYENTVVSHTSYTMETSSDKRQEFYAPLFGSQFPTETAAGEPYQETTIQGLDIELINKKFMGGESFTRELFDDDQTGQITQRMTRLGATQKQLEELIAAGRLQGAAALTFGNATVPGTLYKRNNAQGTSVGPFSTTFYGTRGGVAFGNRPASFTNQQLSVSTLRSALEALGEAFDPQGVPLAILPDTIVVSPFDTWNVKTLLNSAFYPGVPGLAGQTASNATAGSLTGGFAENVLKGALNPHTNVYMTRGAWNIGVAGKGIIFQRRDPVEVVQEVPNSGKSFDEDAIRFRSRSRFAEDWIDASFWYQGNDGTATISQ